MLFASSGSFLSGPQESVFVHSYMDTVRNITKQKVFETLKITFEQEKDQGGILNIQKAARPKQTKVPGYGDSSLAT